MILLMVTISIIYAAIIISLSITWYKDVKHKEDMDKRIQVLERRDAEKETKKNVKQLNDIVVMNTIDLQSLAKRVEKLERKHISKNS